MVLLTVGFTITVLALVSLSAADVPQMINYQGRLTDPGGSPVVDSQYTVTFTIYDDSASGTGLWAETLLVEVSGGLFSVQLGTVHALSSEMFSNPNLWLGITVADDLEIIPRTRFTSVAYAFRAAYADTAATGDDGDWTIAGDDIYRLGGTVGIGTSNPNAYSVLDVRGVTEIGDDGVTPDTWPYSSFGVTRAAVAENLSYIGLTKSGIFPWGIGIGASDQFIIGQAIANPPRTIPSPYIAIDRYSGDVGIGTTSPIGRLDVRGAPLVAGYEGGQIRIVGPIVDGGLWTGGSDVLRIADWETGTKGVFVNLSTGNVGIGRTAPRTRLDVEGTVSAYQDLRIYGDLINYHELRHDGTYGHLVIDPLQGRSVVIPDGNLGIGTTTPASPLHVVGSSTTAEFQQTGPQGLIRFRDQATVNSPHIGSSGDDFVVLTGSTSSEKLRVESAGYLSLRSSGSYSLARFNSGTTVNAPHIGASGDNLVVLAGPGTSEVFRINSNGNVGIGTTSPGYKLHSETEGTTNESRAIYGINTQSGDAGGIGVYGETKGRGKGGPGGCNDMTGGAGSAAGVWGIASYEGTPCGGAAFGVFGRCLLAKTPGSVPSLPGGGYFEGLKSDAPNKSDECTGVFGETWSTAAGSAGVKGTLKQSGAQGRAIWGEASPNGTGWAGYFSGNVNVTGALTASSVTCGGSKCAVVQTSRGMTEVYSQESPEVWFEDFGEGRLQDGQAHIDLDPLYHETVTISKEHPMKVFVSLNDDCKGVYVKRGLTDFVVIELQDGKSDAHFTYRVVAKRKGFEDKRLEPVENFQASLE